MNTAKGISVRRNSRNLLLAIFATFFLSENAFSYAISQELAMVKTQQKAASNSEIVYKEIKTGNYLVVGSFAYIKNAQSYVKQLRNNSNSAHLGYYAANNHYYVFLLNSPDLAKIRRERDKLRSKEQFKDAWVLSIGENNEFEEEGNSEWASNSNKNQSKEVSSKSTSKKPTISNKKEVVVFSDDREANAGATEMIFKDYNIYVNAIDAANFKEVQATVKMIYGSKDKLAGTMEAHELTQVKLPVGELEEIQLECAQFGYRKAVVDFNIQNPVNEQSKAYIQANGDSLIINFEMIRYRKGDIFTMYNVFFHNDAAIMSPKSAYEVNSLMEMIKENEKLKIRLHGHTNGNAYGKIIKMNKNDTDFFNLRPTNESGVGSAKKLSYERALTIKNYLVSLGVDEKRIDVIGWGGKKMVYQDNTNEAKKNARVEVEILQN
jgi:outer membrane protein OmpA-like peptidoglycan-associated protein